MNQNWSFSYNSNDVFNPDSFIYFVRTEEYELAVSGLYWGLNANTEYRHRIC
jgi:hypothetical protein